MIAPETIKKVFPVQPDRTQIELNAMHAIAEALSQLADADARDRVLRWVAGHFSAQPATAPDTVMAGGGSAPRAAPPLRLIKTLEPNPVGDPENLGSLFEELMYHAAPLEEPEASQTVQPVVSMLQNLATDFRKLAEDWGQP